MSRASPQRRSSSQKSKEKSDKAAAVQKNLEAINGRGAGRHTLIAQQPGGRSRTTKEETVRRHSAHASSSITPTQLAGKHTASASSFLFDAVERSSLSAATEAAVQDIACEILEAEDSAVNLSRPRSRAGSSIPADDPWASSDSESLTSSCQKEELRKPAALQDGVAFPSISSTAQSSSPPSAEPEVEPAEPTGGPREASSSATSPRAAQLHRALSQVQTCASQGNFAEAIQECLPALLGPQEVVDIVGSLCAAWQASIKKQKREHQNAMEAMVSEVTSAREKDSPEVWKLLEEIEEKETEVTEEVQRRAQLEVVMQALEEELRGARNDLKAAQQRADQWRRLKDDKERELFAQIRKREDAEREASFLRQSAWLADRTARENVALKKELQKAEAVAATCGASALARQIAEMECSPLRCCRGEIRPAVKKKLMMKWHPDKQPTAEHVEFATQVMQALQNQPEWEM
ncbi:unnamed protein product [Durusdinium trenchii]|uniref:J domain-containing protein n=1 Tax=Durusdinium trenchii TaxID=1381693 RepID=A0ABP0MTB9_9DINO